MKNFHLLLTLLVINCLLVTCSKEQGVQIRGGVPIFLHPDEPSSVHKAVLDLQRDLEAVLGKPSEIVDQLPESGAVIVIATGDRCTGSHPAPTGWEAHQLYTDGNRIVLNGADMRGTIYAIYTFSEQFLGINPLWFWASEIPEKRVSITIERNLHELFPTPDIKYRAWFPNDRDLLTPWQNLSDENYEAFYETMLRLKMNTLEGGLADPQSFLPPYPAGKEAMRAKERGLLVTGHHMLIFGSTYNHWNHYWEKIKNQPAPPLTIENRDGLREFWEFHIDLTLKNEMEVIWLTGFRGVRDTPFWEFFPDAPRDDPSRAKIIEEMVQLQIDLLKEKTGSNHPLVRLTLYNEMSRLVANNHFHVPDEDSLILTFVAARRDHFPNEDLLNYSFKQDLTGYYMNFQFTSSGSHLVQAEGPRKMEQNFRAVKSISGGNLIFSVVNAGNIREHVLELSANAQMMWNFEEFHAGNFLQDFSNRYFGEQYGNEIAALYNDFFNAYWQQKKGDLPDIERQYLFHDMRYARAAEMILTDMEKGRFRPNVLEGHRLDNPDKGSVGYFRVVPADNGTENQVEAILKGTGEAIIRWEQITRKADEIYASLDRGQIFFDDNLRNQAYRMLHLNRMLNSLTRAYRETAGTPQRKEYLQQSIREMELLKEQLNRAGHGTFSGWYDNDRVFGVEKLEKRLTDCLASQSMP